MPSVRAGNGHQLLYRRAPGRSDQQTGMYVQISEHGSGTRLGGWRSGPYRAVWGSHMDNLTCRADPAHAGGPAGRRPQPGRQPFAGEARELRKPFTGETLARENQRDEKQDILPPDGVRTHFSIQNLLD